MTLAAAVAGAAVGVAAAPYLAGLTITVPDRDLRQWWRWAPTSRNRKAVMSVIVGMLAALGGAGAEPGAVAPVYIVAAIVAAPLIVIDAEHHRLPNRLVFTMLWVSLLGLAAGAAATGEWDRLLRSLEAAALVFTLFFLLTYAMPRAFGYGDVKLLAPLSALLGWFGWLDVYLGILAGFILGSVFGVAFMIAGRAGRKSHIAFGPYLLVGAYIVVAVHDRLSLQFG